MSVKYEAPALTDASSSTKFKTDLAPASAGALKALKNLLKAYFAVTALNKSFPPSVAFEPISLDPSAPISFLN